MNQKIEIPTILYERLSAHAKGFDTPANVIERILEFYEEKMGVDSKREFSQEIKMPLSLEIVYYPNSELEFRKKLLQMKKAYICMHKVDGSTELKVWNASSINEASDINANLRSGHLRGWKKKGILKAEVSTNRDDLQFSHGLH
jgi:hypothetical protein